VLLEAGGLEPETNNSVPLESVDLPIPNDCRDRYFGGTRWWGKVSVLTGIDLRRRPWVSLSGWPLDLSELNPYYKEAAATLGVPDLTRIDPKELPGRGFLLDGGPFESVPFFWKRPPIDFGRLLRRSVAGSTNVTTVINATVTEVVLDETGRRVDRLTVRTAAGRDFEVRPKIAVLACGGIENPRLLLASNCQGTHGVGNAHDQVGRYFMDHPKGDCGVVRLEPRNRSLPHSAYWGKRFEAGRLCLGLRLSEAAQEEHRVLDSYVLLQPDHAAHESQAVEALRRTRGQKLAALRDPSTLGVLLRDAPELMSLMSFRMLNVGKVRSVRIENFMEQEPRASNRVTLSERRDEVGSPVARVEWSISELEQRTMQTLHELLDHELRHRSIGVVDSPLLSGDTEPWPIRQDASHHMGTTRMGTDPRTSVVDASCRVHGIENLYIAGSSVFPTSGFANPTLTIMALAFRLADGLLR
jgi:choline dehydrogenase-like flavoprotein